MKNVKRYEGKYFLSPRESYDEQAKRSLALRFVPSNFIYDRTRVMAGFHTECLCFQKR